MVTDFDNDGLRDIIITNGYPRDVTDQDPRLHCLPCVYVEYHDSYDVVGFDSFCQNQKLCL